MKIECNYFDKQYRDKPTGNEVKFTIQKSLKPVTMDIKDLAYGLSHGCTFRPAVLNGTHKADWQRQELFGIDLDHNITIEEGLQRCKDLKLFPAFGYTSFRHKTPEVNYEDRYRLIFHCERMITDLEERKRIQLAFMTAFPECDPTCKNEDRLFFGGRMLIYENYDATFNPDELVKRFYKPSEEKPKKKKTKVKKIESKQKEKSKKVLAEFEDSHNDKINAIKNLDVKRMRELLGITSIESKRNIRIDFINSPDTEKAIHNTIDRLNNEMGFILNKDYYIPKFTTEYLKNISQIIIEEQNKEQVKIKLRITLIEYEEDNNNSDNEDSELESNDRKSGLITKTLINSPPFLPTNGENPPNMLFDSKKDMYDYIDTLDLFEYLGVGKGYFNCIIPKHKDDKPSAHIYTKDNGRQVYKCFGCDRTRSIVSITEELSGCKRHEAIKFIKAVYGLEFNNSSWVQEQQQIMIDSANFLDTEEFKKISPNCTSA